MIMEQKNRGVDTLPVDRDDYEHPDSEKRSWSPRDGPRFSERAMAKGWTTGTCLRAFYMARKKCRDLRDSASTICAIPLPPGSFSWGGSLHGAEAREMEEHVDGHAVRPSSILKACVRGIEVMDRPETNGYHKSITIAPKKGVTNLI